MGFHLKRVRGRAKPFPHSCLVLLLISATAAVHAVNFVYDEALWTKAQWPNWKVDSALNDFNPTEETPSLAAAYPGLVDIPLNSLDGPLPRRLVDASSRAARSSGANVDLEAFGDDSMLEPAAQAAQCSVCHALITTAWRRVTADALNGQTVTKQTVLGHLQKACETEALDEVLTKHVIVKMESEGGAKSFSFFVLRERRPGTAWTGAESAAVRLSCKNLLQDASAELVHTLMQHLFLFTAQASPILSSAGHSLQPGGIKPEDEALDEEAQSEDEDDEEDVYLDPLDDDDEDGDAVEDDDLLDVSNKLEQGTVEVAHKVKSTPKTATSVAEGDVEPSTGDAAATAGADAAAGAAVGADVAAGGGTRPGTARGSRPPAAAAAAGGGGARAQPRRRPLVASVRGGAAAGAAAAGGASRLPAGLRRRLKVRAALTKSKLARILAAEDATGAAGTGTTGTASAPAPAPAAPAESECEDKHPMCKSWAGSGECGANPLYMVGSLDNPGWCRRACGVCRREDTRAEMLLKDPDVGSKLQTLINTLSNAAKNLGCGASKACLTGVSGTAWATSLLKQAGVALTAGNGKLSFKATAEQAYGTTNIGGFVLGKPFYGIPAVKQLPLESLPASARPPSAGTASIASSQVDKATGDYSPPSHEEVNKVLGNALAGKLITLPTEFFEFEYLYKNHTRHYHEDGSTGKVTESWSLGTFHRESVSLISSVTGAAAALEIADLLPDQRADLQKFSWPYVKQVYAGGDECVLAGGRRVTRRVEARIACSPDTKLRMLIREPDFCHYVYVLYVPQLCSMPYYAQRPLTSATGKGGANVDVEVPADNKKSKA